MQGHGRPRPSPKEDAMSGIQGIQPHASNAFLGAASRAQAPAKPAAPAPEFQETALQERQEALSGRQEIGEGRPGPGGLFSITA